MRAKFSANAIFRETFIFMLPLDPIDPACPELFFDGGYGAILQILWYL